MDKSEIRKLFLKKRQELTPDFIEKTSNKIKESLFNLDEFKIAKKFLFYASFKNEVSTHDMIKQAIKTKDIAIPKIKNNHILPCQIKKYQDLDCRNKYCIPECSTTTTMKSPDIIIVPGVAFDINGNRIGFGKGYYDNYIKDKKAVKIGLAFDFQIVDKIPTEDWDIPLNMIVTEKRIIKA